MAKKVLILGGSMAGLAIAHRLLKYTLPNEPDLKVTIVSKNSHFYWNCAAVRAVIPGIIKDEDVLQPIEPGLRKYPEGSAQFILGEATSVDKTTKKVNVSTASGSLSVGYDYLVLATGARAADSSMPWKASSTYEALVKSLHDTTEAIGKASHITIAGAGATGVELAAEIRYEFKDKEVLLLSADPEICGGDWCAPNIEHELNKLGVKIRKNARVEKVEKPSQGRPRVVLESGDAIETGFYMPTMGLVPNSEFLPREWLTEKKYVDVEIDSQVKGEKGIWALGDVVSKPKASFPETDAQATGVARNIGLALKGQHQYPVKGMPMDVFICSMGRDRGAGRVGWIKPPSLTIWYMKGRTLGMEKTRKYVDGTAW